MRLSEALNIVRQAATVDGKPFTVSLCTGFTPLHLRTFLAAHLQGALSGRKVEIETGIFGDLAGTLERVSEAGTSATAVIIEWADLDPRLGVRRLGGWSHRITANLLQGCRESLDRIGSALRRNAGMKPVALVLPSLPLPMIGMTAAWEESPLRLELNWMLDQFGAEISTEPNIRVVSRQELDLRSPLGTRFDLQSEFKSGYPYVNTHADAVADLMGRLLAPPAPKKGIITDLDNTLWAGIVGEEGVNGIAWTLDEHAQIHGLYQQLLASLADTGVLIAIASKNEPSVVELALNRSDMVLTRDKIFPVAAGWGAKSDAIREILETWNIGAESVVFIDDSPLELAEVRSALPDLECLQFSAAKPASVWELLVKLRDLYGKRQVSAEDTIRSESLRNTAQFSIRERSADSFEAFLNSIEPVIEFSFMKDPPDPRALELVNKTNQFNLNGYRFTEADWQAYVHVPETFVMVVSYRDKFGPLGKIAVVAGRQQGDFLSVDRWVMSCRAFSRRIEHYTISKLFDHFAAPGIEFNFARTAKNAPLQHFLADLTGEEVRPMFRLSRSRFLERCPKLNRTLQEI
jgi:FkbH-like protein